MRTPSSEARVGAVVRPGAVHSEHKCRRKAYFSVEDVAPQRRAEGLQRHEAETEAETETETEASCVACETLQHTVRELSALTRLLRSRCERSETRAVVLQQELERLQKSADEAQYEMERYEQRQRELEATAVHLRKQVRQQTVGLDADAIRGVIERCLLLAQRQPDAELPSLLRQLLVDIDPLASLLRPPSCPTQHTPIKGLMDKKLTDALRKNAELRRYHVEAEKTGANACVSIEIESPSASETSTAEGVGLRWLFSTYTALWCEAVRVSTHYVHERVLTPAAQALSRCLKKHAV